jgi:hypothetical protein
MHGGRGNRVSRTQSRESGGRGEDEEETQVHFLNEQINSYLHFTI